MVTETAKDELARALAVLILSGIDRERWPNGTIDERVRYDLVQRVVDAIDARIAGFRGDAGKAAHFDSVERMRYEVGLYANMCDDAAEMLTKALGDYEVMRDGIVEGIRLLVERYGKT